MKRVLNYDQTQALQVDNGESEVEREMTFERVVERETTFERVEREVNFVLFL